MKATMKGVLAVAALSFACASFACTECCSTKKVGLNTMVYTGDTIRGTGVMCGDGVSKHHVIYYKANTVDSWHNCGCPDLCD